MRRSRMVRLCASFSSTSFHIRLYYFTNHATIGKYPSLMTFNRKIGKLTILALILLAGIGAPFVSAQTSALGLKNVKAAHTWQDDLAPLKKYLDKDGGYKDKTGGYYNPKAGTYTDKDGGVVDNWGGYTYKDGSYKSKLGDFYDAPTKTFKLADGTVSQLGVMTAEDAISALRDNVELNGGYDKDMTLKAMIMRSKIDHPVLPVKP